MRPLVFAFPFMFVSSVWANDLTDCEQSKDLGLRISACSTLIARYPNNATAYANRGRAYAIRRDMLNAIADVNRAIKLNPKAADNYVLRARIYKQKGDFSSSIADYSKVIELKPQQASAYIDRGFAYFEQKEIDRAKEDFNKAGELDPELVARFIRGLALLAKGPTEDADVNVRRGRAFYHVDRGKTYEKKDQHARAIAEYTKAIEIDPQYAQAYENRAALFEKSGEREKAEADFAKAKELRRQR